MTGGLSRAAAALVAVVLVASGCGHGSPAISSSASSVLSGDVQRLQIAATSGTAAEVAKSADALRADVAKQRSSGGLSAARGAAVLDQLARVLADSAARPAPTASPTPSAPATSPPAIVKRQPGEKGKGHRK